jgi:C4-dicarboxylate transporter, DctQ subunit
MLTRLSDRLARAEETAAAALAAAVSLLVLANVVARALGRPLYGVSELAVYAMIWMTFLIAAAVLKRRQGIAVTLLAEALPPLPRRLLGLFVDVMVLLFALALMVLCARWLQPLAMVQAGFDAKAFQAETFNFVYAETTSTLGIPKVWVWLVVPWFALSLSLHGLANLVAALRGWRDPPANAGEGRS